MTNDDRTGAFWERHDKLMQDPEHEARFNTELARIRAVDAETNDDDLRTALTKLADDWAASSCSGLVEAHPAPGPQYVLDRRHHVHWSLTESQATPDPGAQALIEAHIAEFEASIARLEASIQDPNNTVGGREYDTAKLHGQRGAVYALRRLADVLAALPAPPVVHLTFGDEPPYLVGIPEDMACEPMSGDDWVEYGFDAGVRWGAWNARRNMPGT